MTETQWPITDCCGIETYYCPQCMTPEPDGDIHEPAWRLLDEVACEGCGDQMITDSGLEYHA